MIRKRPYATSIGSKAKQSATETTCESALRYVQANFPPLAKFDEAFPFVALKHQIYALIDDRTRVDRDLDRLTADNRIRTFKMNTTPNEYAVVWMDDLVAHLDRVLLRDDDENRRRLARKFVGKCLACYADVAVDRAHLCDDLGFSVADIRALIAMGLLTARDVGSYWLSLPGMGAYVQALTKGREAALRAIRSTKYKEIMREELTERKIGACKLGMTYHVLDLVGADLVTRIPTTSGTLLRIDKASSKQ
ncbi:inactive serine/threonine-protein kinase 19-like [Oscarella lobularis]|uniref:inactive serine/threonine-protein kinase 19-like n=1 Tax=Oscarella lobularis TaxID=121494 RepID=UPI00331335A9